MAKEAIIYRGEKTVFSFKWYWENCTIACTKMTLTNYLTPYKNKLKMD